MIYPRDHLLVDQWCKFHIVSLAIHFSQYPNISLNVAMSLVIIGVTMCHRSCFKGSSWDTISGSVTYLHHHHIWLGLKTRPIFYHYWLSLSHVWFNNRQPLTPWSTITIINYRWSLVILMIIDYWYVYWSFGSNMIIWLAYWILLLCSSFVFHDGIIMELRCDEMVDKPQQNAFQFHSPSAVHGCA